MRFSGAALAAISVFLIYLLLPTKTYYWDGVLFSFYAEQAHRGQMAVTALFHPNHLLYTPFAWLVSIPGMRTIRVLQAVNAFCGAGCGLLVFLFARRLTGSQIAAYGGFLLFAFGATWWKFATDADAYIISVLFCLLAVWCALRKDWIGLAGAVAFHVAAMSFHELAVFLYFPVLLALSGMGRRLAYLILSGVSVAGAYITGYVLSGHPGHATLRSWITTYASDTPVTHSARQVIVGYLGSYIKLFAGGKVSLVEQYMGPVVMVSLLTCLGLLIVSFKLWRRLEPVGETKLVPVFAVWFAPMAVFLAIFDPASTFHKLFIWPPLVLLICATARRRAMAFAALAASLACWNFGMFIWPHSHRDADPVLVFADRLSRELPAGAVIYYAAFSPDDWYLRYFGRNEKWAQLPVAGDASQLVCLESTALDVMPKIWEIAQPRWALVSAQHNVRVGCVRAGNGAVLRR